MTELSLGRMQLDVDGATGDLILQEYKSPATARLTKNQEDGFELTI